MQSEKCKVKSAKQGNALLKRHRSYCTRRAFTLVELLVAVALMAILLIMIGTIFIEATQSFRMARAAIEIHDNARAVLNALEKDLTAAEFCTYGTGVQGYFALTQYSDPALPAWTVPTVPPTPPPPNPLPNPPPQLPAFDTLTFTTQAPQAGSLYATPEAVLQIALVRYALQWDGGWATFPISAAPASVVNQPNGYYMAANGIWWKQGQQVGRPTYTLVKLVRFPSTSNLYLNMGSPIGPPFLTVASDAFNNQFVTNPSGSPSNYPYIPNTPNYAGYKANLPMNQLTSETTLDPNSAWIEYAQPEPQAFKVLSMSIRLFCPAPVVNGALQPVQVFTYGGFCTATTAGAGPFTTLVDSTTRPNAQTGSWNGNLPPTHAPPYYPANVRLVAGPGAPATSFPVTTDDGTTITINPAINPPGWTSAPTIGPADNPAAGSQYQIIPYTGYQGVCTGNGTATTLVDTTADRPTAPSGAYVRITGGTGAPTTTLFTVSSDVVGTITINPPVGSPGWTTPPAGPGGSTPATQYQIVSIVPTPLWVQRTNDPNFGTNPFLGMVAAPPALVEITLELTDQRATRSFLFTQRFYIPASER